MADYSYGILIVSDSCYRGEMIDKSGPHIKVLLQRHFNALKIFQTTVPDEIDEIEKMLINFSDLLKLNLIITVGGTGCFRRDVTPQATKNVIEREVPKLTKRLSKGLKNTQFAEFTRTTCGKRGKSLIINFPGNQKACTECFEAVREMLLELMKLICDREIQNNHKEIQHDVKEKVSSSLNCFNTKKTVKKRQQHPKIEAAEAVEIILGKISQNPVKIAIISSCYSNTKLLKMLCQKYGFDVSSIIIVKDDYESSVSIVQEAITNSNFIISNCEILGDENFIIDFDFETHFGPINVKSVESMIFATRGTGTVFFALPGNSLSAFITFYIFVLPALRFTNGFSKTKSIPPTITVFLKDKKFMLEEQPQFVSAKLSYSNKTAHHTAKIISNQADFINADVLLHLPPISKAKDCNIFKGSKLKASTIDQFFVTSVTD